MRKYTLTLLAGLLLGAVIYPAAQSISTGGTFNPLESYAVAGQWLFKRTTSPVCFEGATDDASETCLSLTDPTADRTLTLPNDTDTIATLAGDTFTTTTLTAPTLTAVAITGTSTIGAGMTLTSPASTGKPTVYSTDTTISGDGAIDFALGDLFLLTKGSAAAITLADPVAGDNGREITIRSGSAFAHVITLASGIGGVTSTDDVITFTNRASASITLKCINAKWWIVGSYLAAVA